MLEILQWIFTYNMLLRWKLYFPAGPLLNCPFSTVDLQSGLEILMTEMYKTKNDLDPSFMQEIFYENVSRYNLRNNNEFIQPRVRSVNSGTESIRFKGPQLWQMLPPTIRNSESISQFKVKIKDWQGENCPCKLCRVFIPNLSFL